MSYFSQLLHFQEFLGDIKALGFRTNIPLYFRLRVKLVMRRLLRWERNSTAMDEGIFGAN